MATHDDKTSRSHASTATRWCTPNTYANHNTAAEVPHGRPKLEPHVARRASTMNGLNPDLTRERNLDGRESSCR